MSTVVLGSIKLRGNIALNFEQKIKVIKKVEGSTHKVDVVNTRWAIQLFDILKRTVLFCYVWCESDKVKQVRKAVSQAKVSIMVCGSGIQRRVETGMARLIVSAIMVSSTSHQMLQRLHFNSWHTSGLLPKPVLSSPSSYKPSTTSTSVTPSLQMTWFI